MEHEKSKVTAYVLWLILGAFGAHRFYLGRVKTGIALVGLFVVGIALTVVGSFYMMRMVEDGTQIQTLALTINPFTILSYSSMVLIFIWLAWFVVDLFLINVMINKDRTTRGTMMQTQTTQVFE